MTYDLFLKAASPVLAGDESKIAASDLEVVVIAEHLEDDRFADLLEALSLYSPGSGTPYYNAVELRAVVRRTVSALGLDPPADSGSS